jgi:hypothetical protein
MTEDVEKSYMRGKLSEEFQKELKVRLDKNKMDDVAKRISDKMDIPVEKANAILQFGVADAIMLNRFRNAFKDKDDLKEE